MPKLSDFSPITRRKDHTGSLHAGKSVVTKAGVDTYFGRELGRPNLEQSKGYKIYRPESVIQEALPDIAGLRILNGHHWATADNPMNDKVIGSTMNDPEFKDGCAFVSVVIYPNSEIKNIEDKSKEDFSLGYDSDLEMTPGTTPDGIPYDGIITKIRPEHVALVKTGRVNHNGNKGPKAKIADENPNGEYMTKQNPSNQPVAPEDLVNAAISFARMARKNGRPADEISHTIYTSLGLPNDQAQDLVAKIVNESSTEPLVPILSNAPASKTGDQSMSPDDLKAFLADKSKEDRKAFLSMCGLTDQEKKGDKVLSDNSKDAHKHETRARSLAKTLIEHGDKEEDVHRRLKELCPELAEARIKEITSEENKKISDGKNKTTPKEKTEEEKAAEKKAADDKKAADEKAEQERFKKAIDDDRKIQSKKREDADKAKDKVEDACGKMHGVKSSDSAPDIFRKGLVALGVKTTDSIPDTAIEAFFDGIAENRKSFSTQNSQHLGDSAQNQTDYEAGVNALGLDNSGI